MIGCPFSTGNVCNPSGVSSVASCRAGVGSINSATARYSAARSTQFGSSAGKRSRCAGLQVRTCSSGCALPSSSSCGRLRIHVVSDSTVGCFVASSAYRLAGTDEQLTDMRNHQQRYRKVAAAVVVTNGVEHGRTNIVQIGFSTLRQLLKRACNRSAIVP